MLQACQVFRLFILDSAVAKVPALFFYRTEFFFKGLFKLLQFARITAKAASMPRTPVCALKAASDAIAAARRRWDARRLGTNVLWSLETAADCSFIN